MLGADKGTAPRLDGSDLRVAIVQARFNAAITDSGSCTRTSTSSSSVQRPALSARCTWPVRSR